MEYNISGIVINKVINDKEEELSKLFNLNIEYEEEIDFETASKIKTDNNYIDCYFTEQGTILLTNFDICNQESYSIKDTHVLTFSLLETSSFYYFAYSINEKLIRSKSFSNNEIIEEQGLRLKIEDESTDFPQMIWKQISLFLGKDFKEINPTESVKRYRVINNTTNEDIPNEIIIPKDTAVTKKNTIENTKKNNNLILLYILVAIALLLLFGLMYISYKIVTLP